MLKAAVTHHERLFEDQEEELDGEVLLDLFSETAAMLVAALLEGNRISKYYWVGGQYSKYSY